MGDYIEVEVYVAVDSEGEYGVGDDADEVACDLGAVHRIVKVTVRVPRPSMTEATVTVGDDASTVAVSAQ